MCRTNVLNRAGIILPMEVAWNVAQCFPVNRKTCDSTLSFLSGLKKE